MASRRRHCVLFEPPGNQTKTSRNNSNGVTTGPIDLFNSVFLQVFGCDINDGEIPYYSGECDVPAEPEQLSRCAHVLGAWASGAKV